MSQPGAKIGFDSRHFYDICVRDLLKGTSILTILASGSRPEQYSEKLNSLVCVFDSMVDLASTFEHYPAELEQVRRDLEGLGALIEGKHRKLSWPSKQT